MVLLKILLLGLIALYSHEEFMFVGKNQFKVLNKFFCKVNKIEVKRIKWADWVSSVHLWFIWIAPFISYAGRSPIVCLSNRKKSNFKYTSI